MALNDNPLGIKKVKDAKDLLKREDATKVEASLKFVKGDHWQNAEGWSGPIPPSNTSDYTLVSSEIENSFVSKNVVKEVTDRAVNGVMGREPKITLSFPDKRQTKLISEAEAVVKQWMKDKDFQKYVQKALRNSFIAGKSTLRLYIPSGLLQNGQVLVNDKDPLSFLYLDAPDPLSSAVVVEESTKQEEGIFLGKIKDPNGKEIDTAEITYLLPIENENGKRFTEVTVLNEKGGAESAQLDLDGKLFMHELGMPKLVTDSVISQQKMLNLNLTMMQRNSVLGGYLERVILNGQLPGHYETDDSGNQVFVREEFVTGAGSINAINGVPSLDENGNVSGYTSASINYRDPVSPQTFLLAKDASYRAILEETQQLHALLSGDAVTSGDSRRQAVAGFLATLRIPKYTTERAIEWLVETVLMCAGVFAGNPDKFRGITCTAECKLDSGVITAGEVDLLERQVRVGIISIETARDRMGIEDNDEEQARVEAELAFKERVIKANTPNDLTPDAQQTATASPTLDTGVDNRDIMQNTDTGAAN